MTQTKPPTSLDLPGAEKLTPPQLNALRFSGRHTVLTPELLRKAALRRPRQ